jgi:hypothetical protein
MRGKHLKSFCHRPLYYIRRIKVLTFSFGLIKHDPAYILNVCEILLLHDPNHLGDDLLLDPHKYEAIDNQFVGEVEVSKIFCGDCAIRLHGLYPGDVPSWVDQNRLHILCVGVEVSFDELALLDLDDLSQTFPHKVICKRGLLFCWGRRFRLFLNLN